MIALCKSFFRVVDAMRPRGPLAHDTTARVLHWLLVGLLLWFALYFAVILPFFNLKRAVSALLAVLGMGAWTIALALLRRGFLRWAALIYLSVMYLSASLLIVLYGGVRSATAALYVALPISAAWLLGERAALASAVACLASAFLLALLETMGLRIPRYFQGTPIGIWSIILAATIISAAPVVLVLRILRETLARSRMLSGRLLRLQDDERRRLALELHEGIAQSMAALGMNLAVLQDEVAKTLSAQGHRTLSQSVELADRCIREIRSFAYLLHPPALDRLGLETALNSYVDGFVRRSGIRVDVRMTRGPGELVLEVEDEGHGLAAKAFRSAGRALETGIGIAGMEERARELGGWLELRPTHPQGTTVRAVFRIH